MVVASLFVVNGRCVFPLWKGWCEGVGASVGNAVGGRVGLTK